MTSVNVTTTKNTVTVNGETRVVTVKTRGPQGPSLPDGDKGDVTVSSNGTAISINNNAVTSAKIADGAIVNADINASAAIALSKLATGALPTAITVTSANISDLSIVDADISGSAAISLSKLATGALPTAITVTSANISDLSIVNADINASAAIAGTKINPDFGSQNIVTTGNVDANNFIARGTTNPQITFTDTDDNPDYRIRNNNGVLEFIKAANGAVRLAINSDGHVDITGNLDVGAGLDVTGNITVSGTVDGRDVAADGTKLDGIETGATADQTASEIKTAYESNSDTNAFTDADHTKLDGIETAATSDQTAAEIKTLLDSNGIVNSNVDASAAIDGTKISPDFGSQTIRTTGTGSTLGRLTISHVNPIIFLTDTNNDSDFSIRNASGTLSLRDETNSTARLTINSSGIVNIFEKLNCNGGLDVTGNITVTGTVDGVDIAALNTTVGNLSLSGSVLADGTTATTQSASDNSTKVATTAYTDTAIANLVDSAPGTLNTLNELASALGDDPNFATTVTNSIATKLPLAGGTLTGSVGIGAAATSSTEFLFIKTPDGSSGNNSTKGGLRIKDGSFADGALIDCQNSVGASIFKVGGDLVTTSSHLDVGNGLDVTGNIAVTGTVDGRDLATDGTKLDGIESNATADQTASEIVALVADQTIAPSEIDMEDNEKIKLGTGDDLEIFHSGNHSFIKDVGTGALFICSDSFNVLNAAANETIIKGVQNGAAELYFDNSKKFETSTDGIAITGAVRLIGNSTSFLAGKAHPTLYRTASTSGSYPFNDFGHLIIQSRNDSDNRDIIFATGTNSGKLNRITSDGHLDIFGDNQKLRIGASQDLELYHDGTFTQIVNGNSNFLIKTGLSHLFKVAGNEAAIDCLANTNVKLYYDNSVKLQTESNGAKTIGTHFATKFSSVNTSTPPAEFTSSVTSNEAGLLLHRASETDTHYGGLEFHNHPSSISSYRKGAIYFQTNGTGFGRGDMLFCNDIAGDSSNVGVGDVKLKLDASGNVQIPNDNVRLKIGASQDLQLVHNGSDTFIHNYSGVFFIRSTGALRLQVNDTEGAVHCVRNGAVELYYDNSKKLETTSTGITATGSEHKFVNSSTGDLQLILEADTGNTAGDGENNNPYILFRQDGGNFGDFSAIGQNPQGITTENNALVLANSTTSSGGIIFKTGSTNGYANATEKFRVNTTGILATGNEHKFTSGTSGDCTVIIEADTNNSNEDNNPKLLFRQDGGLDLGSIGMNFSNSSSGGTNNQLYIATGTGEAAISFLTGTTTGYTNASERLKITNDGNVQIPNDSTGSTVGRLQIGASQDLQIYHDGTHSYIDNDTGHLTVTASQINLNNQDNSENCATLVGNGAVNLFFDGSKKFETTSTGVTVTGGVLIGDTTSMSASAGSGVLEVARTGGAKLMLRRNDTSIGANNSISRIEIAGNDPDGSTERIGALIEFNCPSGQAWTTDDYPTHISFSNCKDGSGTPTKSLFISGSPADTKHNVLIGDASGSNMNDYYLGIRGNEDTNNGDTTNRVNFGILNQSTNSGGQAAIDFRLGQASLSNGISVRLTAGKKGNWTNSTSTRDGYFAVDVVENAQLVERLRIDSSGRLGIGTTSPAGELHISSGTSGDCKLIIEADTDNDDEADNPLIIFRQDGGIEESAVGMGFTASNENHLTLANSVTNGGITFATGTTNGYTNAVERLRITSAGNVAITTNDVALSGSGTLRINSGSTAGALNLDGGSSNHGGEINLLGGSNGGRILFRTGQGSGQQDEKMRLDENGVLLVESQSHYSDGTIGRGCLQLDGRQGSRIGMTVRAKNSSGSGFVTANVAMIGFVNGNGTVGHIATNGSATQYYTSSDYRLKENETPISDGITRLKTLKPYRFNFKADPKVTVDGFFAHEVTAVPEATSGTKDEVNENNEPIYQSIDQAKLVPLLVAALQEAIGRIEALEAK